MRAETETKEVDPALRKLGGKIRLAVEARAEAERGEQGSKPLKVVGEGRVLVG